MSATERTPAKERSASRETDVLTPLEALSPVDGRYRLATAALRPLLSEGGLIRERV